MPYTVKILFFVVPQFSLFIDVFIKPPKNTALETLKLIKFIRVICEKTQKTTAIRY